MTPIEHYILTHSEIEIEDLRAYFNCPKYKGKYFAQMKKEVNRHLRKKGLTCEQTSQVLGYANHSMVSLSLNNHVDVEKNNVEIIRNNWKEWVRYGLYPKTIKNGERLDKQFELVEKGEL